MSEAHFLSGQLCGTLMRARVARMKIEQAQADLIEAETIAKDVRDRLLKLVSEENPILKIEYGDVTVTVINYYRQTVETTL